MTDHECVRIDDCGDPADLLVDFLNTLDVEDGTDLLRTRQGWSSWRAAHGLDTASGSELDTELEVVRDLRADLRDLAAGGDVCDVRLPIVLRVDHGRAGLAGADGPGIVGAAVAQLAVEGRLVRIKICPADHCRVAFYDTSKNQSRQWCSMKVCGNRAKARHHRERAAVG